MAARLNFESLEWEVSPLGARFKAFESNGKKIRLVEMSPSDLHPDWCVTGHTGYIISGEMEIEFSEEIVKYKTGDGLEISPGETSKHRPKALTEKVLLFLVDQT